MSNKLAVAAFLTRRIQNIYPSKEAVLESLTSGKKLRLYFGIDATGPELHLGHSVGLLAMKQLADFGHEVIILFGDFTGQIGDPSGKENTRKQLTEKEVKENIKTYKNQVSKVLQNTKFKIKQNSDWLAKISFGNILNLASQITVQQLIARDMFQKRISEGKSIGLHEFFYPLMQGYDSVAMEVDGEVGGNDQVFNMLVGRDLEKKLLNKEKLVLATKLLEDPTTGKKLMNKSEGDFVALNSESDDMYGKIMSLPDAAIIPIFELCTEVEDDKIFKIKERLQSENPKNLKEELAFEIVKMYHGEKRATQAKMEFKKIFSKGENPGVVAEFSPSHNDIVQVLVEWLHISKSEAKRLVEQKAVHINNDLITNWEATAKPGDIIKSGPHRFIKIK